VRRGLRRTIRRVDWGRGWQGGEGLASFDFFRKSGPVGLFPAGSGPIVVVGGGANGDQDGGVVGPCGGEGRCVPGAETVEHMWVGKSQVDDARSVASCEGEPSINARGIEKSET